MVDTAQYLSILIDPEKLLIALPITIIIITLLTLLIPYVKSLIKKRSGIKTAKKDQKLEKINFRYEFNNILMTGNIETATANLSLLANKFLSQLFKIGRVFTYDEVKKEADVYNFPKIIELCDVLSELNFGKNSYSKSDTEKLRDVFKKVLDSYEYIIVDEHKNGNNKGILNIALPAKAGIINRFLARIKSFFSSLAYKPTPSSVSFKDVWKKLTPVMKEMQIKQLEKYLLVKHANLLSTETKQYDERMTVKDKKAEILRLIKVGRVEISKADTLSASSSYNNIVSLFNSLAPKDRESLSDEVNNFHMSVLSIIALKASNEVIENINKALTSNDNSRARQLFHELEYLYTRLPSESSKEVYQRWLELTKKIQ